MSPHANVSNGTEMTSLGNLDETVPVQDDVSHPARNKATSTSATPPNALGMPCDSDSIDEQKLTKTSNTFWSTQTAKYPNYGTTKKRRLHEINYLVEKLQEMKEGDVVSLTDVGCGTGSTVTVLQEMTDIKTYHCYDISPAMISLSLIHISEPTRRVLIS